MKQFLSSAFDEIECGVLGIMMTMLPLALIGAGKVWLKGGTSDGILFDLLLYGFPLWVAAPFVIASNCGRRPGFRRVCRFVVYGYFAIALTAVVFQ
jgi:hypothetical protein